MRRNNNHKHLYIGLVGILGFYFLTATPTILNAMENTPLNPQVPRVVGEQTSVAGMLEGIFTLSIAAAGILAAIMIAIAGIQYMGTDAYSSKEQAKDRIRGAVLGLLIIFSAVLFLRVINPDLVSIRFALQNISIKPDDWAPPGFGIGSSENFDPDVITTFSDEEKSNTKILAACRDANGVSYCTEVNKSSAGNVCESLCPSGTKTIVKETETNCLCSRK